MIEEGSAAAGFVTPMESGGLIVFLPGGIFMIQRLNALLTIGVSLMYIPLGKKVGFALESNC
jgi:hypothetical protein